MVIFALKMTRHKDTCLSWIGHRSLKSLSNFKQEYSRLGNFWHRTWNYKKQSGVKRHESFISSTNEFLYQIKRLSITEFYVILSQCVLGNFRRQIWNVKNQLALCIESQKDIWLLWPADICIATNTYAAPCHFSCHWVPLSGTFCTNTLVAQLAYWILFSFLS